MERENLKRANELDAEIKHLDDVLEKLDIFKLNLNSIASNSAVVSLAHGTGGKEVEAFIEKERVLEIAKIMDSSIIIQRNKLFDELKEL